MENFSQDYCNTSNVVMFMKKARLGNPVLSIVSYGNELGRTKMRGITEYRLGN